MQAAATYFTACLGDEDGLFLSLNAMFFKEKWKPVTTAQRGV
jgi:hypothetical protein